MTSPDCKPHRRVMKSKDCIIPTSHDLTTTGHGPQTGLCVPDRYGNITVCQIRSWCPVEDDQLVLGKKRPLIMGSEHHTVFIKNSIKFSYFGEKFHRNNMPVPGKICVYNFSDPGTNQCNIFRLGMASTHYIHHKVQSLYNTVYSTSTQYSTYICTVPAC